MTLVSEIITQSLRESNVIAISASPTPDEATEALDRLQSVVLSVLGNEIGYVLEDWNVATATSILKPSGFAAPTSGFTVNPQSRLICNLTEETTLNLDPQPQDGQRLAIVDAKNNFSTFNLILNGNGRLIEGSTSQTISTDLTRKQWVYRSDQSNWVTVDPITSGGEMPFPEEFDDYFIILLAMRLNPRFGRPLTEESALRMKQQHEQLLMRYNQSRIREAKQMQAMQAGAKG